MKTWVRYTLAVIVFIAWGAMMFASMTANINFGLTLAGQKGLNPWAMAAATGASDVMKAIAPVVGLWFLVKRWWWPAAASGLVLGVTLVFSIVAAIGYSATQRVAYGDSRTLQSIQSHDLVQELNELNKQRSWQPSGLKPSKVYDAELKAKRQEPFWTYTDGCTDLKGGQSRKFCAEYRQAGVDLVAAQEKEELDRKIAVTRSKMAAQGLVTEADPQAAWFAKTLSIDITNISLALVLLFAVLVEVGSACGLTLALTLIRPDHGPLAAALGTIAPGKAEPVWDPRKAKVEPAVTVPLVEAPSPAPAAGFKWAPKGKPSPKKLPSPPVSAKSSAATPPMAAHNDTAAMRVRRLNPPPGEVVMYADTRKIA